MATLSIKVVPGAKRSRVVGRYGNAIKVQVIAAPEDGKANQAAVAMIAAALGVKGQQVRISRGQTQPRKTVEVDGMDQAIAEQRLLAATE